MEENTGHRAAPGAIKSDGPLGADSSTEMAEDETIEVLRSRLAEAHALNEEQMRGWQRTQADFVNHRRRVEQEREELTKFAEASLMHDLLPVLDDLERALTGLTPALQALTWVGGVLLIERKLRATLEGHGLKAIEALGKEFDPHEHEAVIRDGDPSEATLVTAQLQAGYRIHDRVLRPTLVKVGPPAPANS